jgi:uncharacterized membrane protein YphA (DoxX/SURF4 family)/thiol-disulfide isomerase/thioredoxin
VKPAEESRLFYKEDEMKDKIQQLLSHQKVLLASRLLLGSIFIAASLGKVANPDDFVKLVTSYNILPAGLAQLFGMFLPWVELIIGSFLILGVFSRLASGIGMALTASFIVANFCSLLCGSEASCGCFGQAMPLSHTQSLLLDGAMLLMAAPLLLRRDEPWLAIPLPSASRAFSATMAVLLLLGPFLPQATPVAARLNVDEAPVTISQPVVSNTAACGGGIPVEVENVIKVGPNTPSAGGSIDQRISASLETSEAVFLFFYADWCHFCQNEKPIIDALEQQYSGQITFLRLNNEKEAEAFKQFSVTGFPTMYLITGEGENGNYVSQKFVGLTDETKLKASFNLAASGGDGTSQGSASATMAPPTNNLEPVLNQNVACFQYYNPTDCTVPGCKWCATSMTCIQSTGICKTCNELTNTQCLESTICHWCGDMATCFPNGRPCTCGDKIVQSPEQCDGGANCTSNCQCPVGMVPDGNRGCQATGGMCETIIDKSVCTTSPGCFWCATMGACYPFSQCITCEQMPQELCVNSPTCHWCANLFKCIPNERPCTCGDNIVQAPEQCDGGTNCNNNCQCPEGYENDGGNGCQPIVVLPVCGNGILETGEECEPVFGGRFCDPVSCKCMPDYVPDPQNLGFCKAAQICGNGILEGTEECDSPSPYCADCQCIGGTVPDHDNSGYCKAAQTDGCPDDPDKTEPGICGCGVADTDSDGDGTADCLDACPNDENKTEPSICGCGTADTDSDGDGVADCNDACPNDANKTAPGICGCGVADTDSDSDGTPDCNDGCPNDANKTEPGICGCGVADTDSDGDGTADCLDACPNDANKTEPGICGCGVADTDSDGDGTADCLDNCPDKVNSDQADFDGDGLGDACDPVYATVDIDPNSLNLKSKSDKNAITAYVELPVEAEVSQIDINTVVLDIQGSMIAAQLRPTSVGDHDNDGIADIMVKFERQELISMLANAELSIPQKIAQFFGWKVDLTLSVNGYLYDGRHFTGQDTIKVILPGK